MYVFNKFAPTQFQPVLNDDPFFGLGESQRVPTLLHDLIQDQ